jgi:hypothetical protein
MKDIGKKACRERKKEEKKRQTSCIIELINESGGESIDVESEKVTKALSSASRQQQSATAITRAVWQKAAIRRHQHGAKQRHGGNGISSGNQ